jgi:hypothetical protein
MSKKFIIIITLLFLIFIIGGFFWWSWIHRFKEGPLIKEESKINEIANWKTYSDDKYNFEVKYPPEWKIIDEEPLYISPFSKKQIESGEEHFGFFVMEYPKVEKEKLLHWVETEIIVPKLSGTSPEFEVKISEDLNKTTSLKVEFQNLKDPSSQRLHEGVTYWLVRNEDILRVAYDYPSEERSKYKTIFERMFSTFRFTGKSQNIVINFPESEELKKVVFKSKPPSGFLIPTEDSVPPQFKLTGSVFTDDYVRYHYTHCYKGDDNLEKCSIMNISEDKRESYEEHINQEYLKPPKYITERKFNFQNSEGRVIYYYYEGKLSEGWLYFNRSGHLLTIHTTDQEFLSDPDNFINLLKKLQISP